MTIPVEGFSSSRDHALGDQRQAETEGWRFPPLALRLGDDGLIHAGKC